MRAVLLKELTLGPFVRWPSQVSEIDVCANFLRLTTPAVVRAAAMLP